jgi:hypothetical protein
LAPPELTLLADRIRVEAGIAGAAEFAAVN